MNYEFSALGHEEMIKSWEGEKNDLEDMMSQNFTFILPHMRSCCGQGWETHGTLVKIFCKKDTNN